MFRMPQVNFLDEMIKWSWIFLTSLPLNKSIVILYWFSRGSVATVAVVEVAATTTSSNSSVSSNSRSSSSGNRSSSSSSSSSSRQGSSLTSNNSSRLAASAVVVIVVVSSWILTLCRQRPYTGPCPLTYALHRATALGDVAISVQFFIPTLWKDTVLWCRATGESGYGPIWTKHCTAPHVVASSAKS